MKLLKLEKLVHRMNIKGANLSWVVKWVKQSVHTHKYKTRWKITKTKPVKNKLYIFLKHWMRVFSLSFWLVCVWLCVWDKEREDILWRSWQILGHMGSIRPRGTCHTPDLRDMYRHRPCTRYNLDPLSITSQTKERVKIQLVFDVF